MAKSEKTNSTACRAVAVLVFLTALGGVRTEASAAPQVRVKVYGQHVGTSIVYRYEVINDSPNSIVAVHVGYHSDRETWDLQELPVGWALDTGIPAGSATSPAGWGVTVIQPEETPSHALEWRASGPEWDLLPGQVLEGLTVVVRKADIGYLTSHAEIILGDGDPKHFPVPLELADMTPPTLSLALAPATLWPPDGKLVTVTASISVADNLDPNPEVRLESITADEPLAPNQDI